MVKSTDRTKKIIAETIRTLRKKNGMTQEALADAIGTVGKATVSSWESGRTCPNADTLNIIATVFDEPVDKFYTGELISLHYFAYAPDDPEPDVDLKTLVEAYNTVNDEGKKYLRECALFAMSREMFKQ